MTFLALVLAIVLALFGFMFTYRFLLWAVTDRKFNSWWQAIRYALLGACGLAGAAWAGALWAGLS